MPNAPNRVNRPKISRRPPPNSVIAATQALTSGYGTPRESRNRANPPIRSFSVGASRAASGIAPVLGSVVNHPPFGSPNSF